MARVYAPSLVTVSIKLDDVVTISGSCIESGSFTARHLFSGGPGNRPTSNLLARSDGFTRSDNVAIVPATLENLFPGLSITVNGIEYHIMQCSLTADGGLIRIILDSPDTVGR